MNSKSKVIILAMAAFMLAATSCEKYRLKRAGFDGEYSELSKGLTILDVSPEANIIYLDGFMDIQTGMVKVKLLDANDEVVFSDYLDASKGAEISEQFEAISGYWKLKYESIDSHGYIKLHINY